MESGEPPREPPRDPSTGDFPTGDYPTGDYPTRDYPELDPEERARRRIPRDRRPPPRHRRHRDLPAKVRRRQATAVAVIAVVVIGGGALLLGGGDDEKSTLAAETPFERLVGQTLIGKMAKGGPSKKLLQRVRKGQLGGVIVGADSVADLKRFTNQLTNAAAAGEDNPPLLLFIDQEGGPVKRAPGPPTTSPAELGKSGDVDASKAQGELTGEFLKNAGVNANLAPVADVVHTSTPQTLATRMFGSDPAEVGALATAFAQGLQENGVAAVVKHFPGLGYTDTNPDFGTAVVGAAPAQLAADVTPFKDAIDGGVAMVMLSTASYPTLGSRDPATWAPPIVQDQLREQLGFEGVAITDDLESASATDGRSSDEAATLSLRAGVDMVLFAKSAGASRDAYESLLNKAEKGKLPRATLEQAYSRILALKDRFATD